MGNEELSEEKLYELKRIIKFLDSCAAVNGHSTTLITIAIPPRTPLSEVTSLVSRELATAQRIKSRTTRKHVIDALQSISARLKYWREVPPTGLVIYSGVTNHGKIYLEVIPPKPLPIKLYKCDSKFETSFLKEMLSAREKYGIILVEAGEATFGVIDGSVVRLLKHISYDIPSKHGKGGQSARRFERQIEQAREEFLKKVGEFASKFFANDPSVKGIIIGGPGFFKEDLLKGDYLRPEIKRKILGTISTQYLGEAGLREAAFRAMELIQKSQFTIEQKAWEEIMSTASRSPNMVASGWREVAQALIEGRAELILVSEDLSGYVLQIILSNDDYEERIELAPEDSVDAIKNRWMNYAAKRGMNIEIKTLSDDAVEWVLKRGKEIGARVILINPESEVGEMLKRTFGGIVAKLRF